MQPTRFHFRHRAVVPAARSEVAELLLDLEHYPDWWRQVRAVASLGPDDALVICRSVLPYDLELHLHARHRTHSRLEVDIDGPIAGFARWELTERGIGTCLEFSQEVVATGRALAAASYVVRPLLRLNHDLMMRSCVQGLEQALASRP